MTKALPVQIYGEIKADWKILSAASTMSNEYFSRK